MTCKLLEKAHLQITIRNLVTNVCWKALAIRFGAHRGDQDDQHEHEEKERRFHFEKIGLRKSVNFLKYKS